MTYISAHRGHYLIDNSSIGLPREEYDTWTCHHCQGQVVASAARERPREVCLRCMRVVCDRCKAISDHWGCQPFDMIAEAVLGGKYKEHPVHPGLLLPD